MRPTSPRSPRTLPWRLAPLAVALAAGLALGCGSILGIHDVERDGDGGQGDQGGAGGRAEGGLLSERTHDLALQADGKRLTVTTSGSPASGPAAELWTSPARSW